MHPRSGWLRQLNVYTLGAEGWVCGRMEMSKMKNKSDSKQFKALVRDRMAKTGESYAVAKAQLVKQRIKVEKVGRAIAGGKLVPRRQVKAHPKADSTQLFKALFGSQWKPPTKRCPKCHAWISYDGWCECNAHERSMEVTEIVEITPVDSPPDDDPETLQVKQKIQEWMELPLISENPTADSWPVAARVGCLIISTDAAEASGLYSPTPFDLDQIALGDVTIQVDGEWRRHRLPIELGWWASEQVQDACDGRNRFPAFIAVRRVNDSYDVGIRSLRA